VDLIYRYDPNEPLPSALVKDAAEAQQILVDGNRNFVEFVSKLQESTLGAKPESMIIPIHPVSIGVPVVAGGKTVQAPFALFVGCSDARVNIETIFNQWFNGMFVVRVAGNVLGTECLGSLNFAVMHLDSNLRLVAVLGHSDCGAVSAAVASYLKPEDFGEIAFTHSLRSLVDRIQIAVRIAAKTLAKALGGTITAHPNYRTALIEASVYINAAVTAYDVLREVGNDVGRCPDTVYTVYDFSSLLVTARPPLPGEDLKSVPPFRPAPTNSDELRQAAEEIAFAVAARHLTTSKPRKKAATAKKPASKKAKTKRSR
jgi:carbonic anhydrase